MKRGAFLVIFALLGCNRQPSAEERAEDVGEAAGAAAAREVSAEQYREIDERLDRLEHDNGENFNAHVSMMNAVVETSRTDRAEVARLRDHYNTHLREQHGAR